MDALAMMVTTAPLVVPIIVAQGIDPIWFGVLMMILSETGMITPPFGINLFVVQSVRRRGALTDVIVGASLFLGRDVLHDHPADRFPGNRHVAAHDHALTTIPLSGTGQQLARDLPRGDGNGNAPARMSFSLESLRRVGLRRGPILDPFPTAGRAVDPLSETLSPLRRRSTICGTISWLMYASLATADVASNARVYTSFPTEAPLIERLRHRPTPTTRSTGNRAFLPYAWVSKPQPAASVWTRQQVAAKRTTSNSFHHWICFDRTSFASLSTDSSEWCFEPMRGESTHNGSRMRTASAFSDAAILIGSDLWSC